MCSHYVPTRVGPSWPCDVCWAEFGLVQLWPLLIYFHCNRAIPSQPKLKGKCEQGISLSYSCMCIVYTGSIKLPLFNCHSKYCFPSIQYYLQDHLRMCQQMQLLLQKLIYLGTHLSQIHRMGLFLATQFFVLPLNGMILLYTQSNTTTTSGIIWFHSQTIPAV